MTRNKAMQEIYISQDDSMKINVRYDPPPIPTRSHDWIATLDGYEPGDPIGHGRTSAEAIKDLVWQIEEAGQ